MSRTAIYKSYYFLLLATFGALAIWVLVRTNFSRIAFAAILMAYLIPGRILGFFWRDQLRGLRLLNARDYEASKRCSERFLIEIERKPWLRHLIWLGSSSYSRNPKVLALNNLGAAEIKLGQIDSARRHLERAIEIDMKCPLPYFNLGVLHRSTGEAELASAYFTEAVRLGFTRGLSDKIVMASQTRFAATDGRGRV